ncbi:short-chain dehydrogenase/reductase SDR [Nitrosococcus halophilus Nc 4]|uniref:Short-chain dehydrogenase/reductase SDR n=1 Tax=Nitrosococcus halophilus (strain Nc4) TaxID=472759 RepID=D5C188_NITHN|nr:SDR family oxidoreductase [Nitrosococcus halophilus]ADE16440.1 short-chain dehydrogenase/reductase SDR [Nitrosococcus halophilus Nc 4]
MWFKKNQDDFTDQGVLITGGSRGIGLVTAQAFLEKGARVAICSLSPERLSKAEQQLRQQGEIMAIPADVRDFHQLQQFVNQAQAQFGRIDILVNNAGVAWSGDFVEETIESIDKTVEVNLKGVLYATHAVLPLMVRQKRGTIINVSSGAGLSGFAGLVSYCASKFGVVGFTESLAQEVGPQGIRVFGICPGRVATDMQEAVSGQKIGLPPEKVGQKIVQLAGRHPPISTGKCLVISS